VQLGNTVGFILFIALILSGLPGSTSAQALSQLGPASADVNCTNFLAENDGGRDHAQAVFAAAGGLDGNDPYLLDADGNQVACDGAAFGSEAPATCLNFQAASHAQALLDATAPSDPYSLDPDGNGVACDGDGGGADAEEPLDGPPPPPDPDPATTKDPPRGNPEPPDTAAPAAPPVASGDAGRAGSPGSLDTLEARLDARFAALEARFAAFELRAEDGFGKFPDADADQSTSGAATATIVVSPASEPLTAAQRGSEDHASNLVARAQRASISAADEGRAAQNADKQRGEDDENARAKERKSKSKSKSKNDRQHVKRDRPQRNHGK
jgi:hypothetical protein